MWSYLPGLHHTSQHDNINSFVLPYHSPEVTNGGRQGTCAQQQHTSIAHNQILPNIQLHVHYSGTSIIRTPLATVVWSCVRIIKILWVIKITAEHTQIITPFQLSCTIIISSSMTDHEILPTLQ